MNIKEANLQVGDKFTVEFTIIDLNTHVSNQYCRAMATGITNPNHASLIRNETEVTNVVKAKPLLSVGMKFPLWDSSDPFSGKWVIIALSAEDKMVMAKYVKADVVGYSGFHNPQINNTFTFDEVYDRLGY